MEVVMHRYPLCFLTLGLSISSSTAQILPASADVLDAFPHSLVDARGVVVVPGATQVQGRCPGLLIVKGDDGWGEPVPVVLGGVLQTETSDMVLVIRSRRSLSRITEGDGKVDSEVTAYAGKKAIGTSVEGMFLMRGPPLAKSLKNIEEIRARLAVLSTAPAKAESKTDFNPLQTIFASDNREMLLGGVAAVATFLAAFRGRKK
jgi:hypothetical protein